MELHIEVSRTGDVINVALSGEIDAYTAPKLKEALLPTANEAGVTIRVDLENVHYMDSTGLGVFISAIKSTKENNGHLILVHLQERVYRLFDITGLKQIMTIESTVRGGV